MAHTFDVLVVGAGVIAKAIALSVAKTRSVVLFAPSVSEAGSASAAAGAMLGSFAEFSADRSGLADQYEGDLRIRAGRAWLGWFAELAEGSAFSDAVRRGTFVVATNHGLDDVENAEFIARQADQHDEPYEWVDPREVAGLEPHRLSRARSVLYLPTEGYIDTGTLRRALDHALVRSPMVTVVDEAVTSLRIDEGRLSAVTGDGVPYFGEDIVIAAGVASAQLADALELDPRSGAPVMLGGRGTSVVVDCDVRFDGVIRTPNRDFACGTHVVPLTLGRAYLGATNRLETEDFSRPRPTVGELHSLCHSLSNEINVRLRTAPVVEVRCGYRPICADGYPAFGRTAHPHVYLATGTYRNGVLLAPEIADTIAREIGELPPGHLNPFAPLERDKLHVDRDTDTMLLASLRNVVSFAQEPDGNLPFDRATELVRLMSGLLKAATRMDGGAQIAELFDKIVGKYPIAEAMPILLYEVLGR